MVLLPVAVACVWAGGWWFTALCVLGWIGLGVEWSALCGFPAMSWPGIALPVSGALAVLCAASGQPWAGLALLAAGGLAAAALGSSTLLPRHSKALPPRHPPARPEDDALRSPASALKNPRDAPENPGDRGARVLPPSRISLALGFPYLGLAAVALLWLRADPVAGWPNTLFVLSVIWASDIGAYMAGRLAGGPKLAPSISPGKTWSGAVGGLISAVLAAQAVAACFSPGFSPSHVAGLALGLSVVSQAGDLLESALKRHFGVKDSGHVIPGHGGLLDRLDALLTVAPAAALLALSVGRGVVLWR